MSNLELWQKFEMTDPKYTKNFTKGGGFSGTAINPMYSARRMTEEFGPCGIGWGAEEAESRIEEGGGGTKVWFSKVRVWYEKDGKRGLVEQWGATEFCGVRKGKNGGRDTPFTDEEAAKKSFTDAFSKCVSLLGLGADIYLNHPGRSFDGCKWTTSAAQEEEKPEKPKIPEPPAKTKFDEAFEAIGEHRNDFPKLLKYFKTVENCVSKKVFSLEQAGNLACYLVPTALEACKSVSDGYEVMTALETLQQTKTVDEKTVSKLSKACAERLEKLGV